MYHVNLDMDLENEETKEELKQKYGIINAKRIIKKSNKEPLLTVKITFDEEKNYNQYLNNGLFIGKTFFRIKPWKTTKNLKQCFKCLKLGHLKFTCKQTFTTCLRCGETHDEHFSECQKDLKCSNCKQNHAACSKICIF